MTKTDTGSKKFNGHKSVAIARIGTKFDVETKTDVHKTVLPSDFIFEKYKMAATTILNFCLMATTL